MTSIVAGDNMTSSLSVFVVGYTGATGMELIKLMSKSAHIKRVVLFGRRQIVLPIEANDSRFEQVVVDFDSLETFDHHFKGLDAGFCCLGTTRAQAGQEGFIRVDHDYVMKTAEVSRAQGVAQFHLVSSAGANKRSTFLYPRIKGQVEDNLAQLAFSRLHIYHPKLLIEYGTPRQRWRPMESFCSGLLRPVAYFCPTLATTPVPLLAKAMLNVSLDVSAPQHVIYDNKDIFRLAEHGQ